MKNIFNLKFLLIFLCSSFCFSFSAPAFAWSIDIGPLHACHDCSSGPQINPMDAIEAAARAAREAADATARAAADAIKRSSDIAVATARSAAEAA